MSHSILSRRPSGLKIRTSGHSPKLDLSTNSISDLDDFPLLRRICSSPKLFVTADIGPKSSKRTKRRVMMASPLGPTSPSLDNGGSFPSFSTISRGSHHQPGSPIYPASPTFPRAEAMPLHRSFSLRESHRRSVSSHHEMWSKRGMHSINQPPACAS